MNPIRIYWWLIALPGGVLVTALLALNLVGDGLRDAWDVRGRQE
jgi:ABC-type dipeptide/oligopeptide/nickel transport system permease subunit